MKALLANILPSIRATLALAAVTCIAYPLAVTGVAQVLFPERAHGSLIMDKQGTVRGSALQGQAFTSENYFHPRPSAAGSGYDAAGSSGSNLGPTSRKLRDLISERVVSYRTVNQLSPEIEVPADAVTASASGLDPHISVRNAGLQAPRVAKSRNLSVEHVRKLIEVHTERPSLRLFGEAGVNVLKLNLALDE